MILYALYGLVLAALALPVSGWLAAPARPVAQEATWEQVFPAAGVTTLGLDTLNGSIAAEAWDRPEIAARAVLRADPPASAEARRQLDGTQVVFGQDGSALRGEVQVPQPADGVSADFTIRVPRDLALELRSGSGAISVTGVAAPLSLQSSNGSLAVANAPGPLTLETASGSVAVNLPAGAGAQLDLVTANGQISVPGAGVQGTTQLTTILGQGGPRVQVRTGNGSITVMQGP